METVLQTYGLTKQYGSFTALSNLDLALERGKIIGLLGPNGSGKTTFIKLCCGLIKPTAGDILICGMPIGVETKKVVSYLSGFLQQFQCSKGSGYDEQAGDKPCGKVQDNVKGYKRKGAALSCYEP